MQANWRNGTTAPFESNWSRVHKFAFLNKIDAISLKRTLSGKDWRHKPQLWGHKVGQLLFIGHFDSQILADVFHETASVLEYGWLQPYHFLAPNGTEFANNLRYCPICIQSGYHTPLFQMLWLRRCPIHHIALSHTCPKCQAAIPLTLTNQDLTTQYGCRCGERLWPDLEKITWQPGITSTQARSIAAVVDWLQKLRAQSRTRFLSSGFVNTLPDRKPVTIDDDTQLSIPSRWLTCFDPNHIDASLLSPEKQAASYCCVQSTRYLRDHHRYEKRMPHDDLSLYRHLGQLEARCQAFTPQYQAIYTTVKRYIMKSITPAHAQCLAILRNWNQLAGHAHDADYEICPIAYAFWAWQTHWDPQRVNRYNSSNFTRVWFPAAEFAQHLASQIDATLILKQHIGMLDDLSPQSHWVATHLLYRMLIDTFIEALWVTVQAAKTARSLSPGQSILGRLPLYYIMEYRDEASVYRLHLWSSRFNAIASFLHTASRQHGLTASETYESKKEHYFRELLAFAPYHLGDTTIV